jgi:hypothetical protein
VFGLGSYDPTETIARNSGVSPSTSSSGRDVSGRLILRSPAALRRIRVIGVDGTRNLMLGLKALRMVDANVQRGREAGHAARQGRLPHELDRAQPVIEPNHRAPERVGRCRSCSYRSGSTSNYILDLSENNSRSSNIS